MVTRTQPVTAEELLQMPDDGYRYELVRGGLRKMPPAGGEHGEIAHEIGWHLGSYVRAHRLGKVYAAETGFRIGTNPDTVLAPDAAFVSQERLAPRQQGYPALAPDLVAEVVSLNDRPSEVAQKVADWLAAGTRMVLVIEPRQRTLTIHRSPTDVTVLTENDQLEGGDVVPGWTLTVRELLA